MLSVRERGDVIFEDGDFVALDEVEDIKQCLLAIFNTRKGEFFLDIDYGLDYTALEDKRSSDNDIKASLMDAIAQEERITSIESIEIERERKSRQVKIYIELKAHEQEIKMEEVL